MYSKIHRYYRFGFVYSYTLVGIGRPGRWRMEVSKSHLLYGLARVGVLVLEGDA